MTSSPPHSSLLVFNQIEIYEETNLKIISLYNISLYSMPLAYAKNKVHIYKYRITHREQFLEMNRISKRRYDAWKRIQKIYLNILLDED